MVQRPTDANPNAKFLDKGMNKHSIEKHIQGYILQTPAVLLIDAHLPLN